MNIGRMDLKYDLVIHCLQKIHITQTQICQKGQKEDTNQRRAGVSILITDKIEKIISVIKGSVFQANIITNTQALKNGTLKYMKKT